MNDMQVPVSMDRVRERLSTNIRRLRAERKVSQERLALDAGVDRTMLSKIERRISNPSIETLLKLANRLSVDIVTLLCEDESPGFAQHRAFPIRSALSPSVQEPGLPPES